ncbi:hypothetical protein GZH49_12090 [Nocardia terpenica]|uniref:hypothetical protein n=1 Tax=Nocardia terpenica TaxID=455432 RepID=UPI002FE113B7
MSVLARRANSSPQSRLDHAIAVSHYEIVHCRTSSSTPIIQLGRHSTWIAEE